MKISLARFAVLLSMMLSGCVAPNGAETSGQNVRPDGPKIGQVLPDHKARRFISVVETIEPIAERECARRTRGLNCDFLIVVDDRANLPPNAFFTLDDNGRPLIAFTISLLDDARNPDELALIMGHEASHHILAHIPQTLRNQALGARIGAIAVSILGGTAQEGANLGAAIGARRYSREFELEADALGTIIAAQGGYDPILAAEYFDRIADPGNQVLGSHPANAQRIAVVRQTVAGL